MLTLFYCPVDTSMAATDEAIGFNFSCRLSNIIDLKIDKLENLKYP